MDALTRLSHRSRTARGKGFSPANQRQTVRASRVRISDAKRLTERPDALVAADRSSHGAVTADPVRGLTPMQARVARLVAECATNKQIAAALALAPSTVEGHLRSISYVWQLDRSRNLRTQIALRYCEHNGFPRLGALSP